MSYYKVCRHDWKRKVTVKKRNLWSYERKFKYDFCLKCGCGKLGYKQDSFLVGMIIVTNLLMFGFLILLVV